MCVLIRSDFSALRGNRDERHSFILVVSVQLLSGREHFIPCLEVDTNQEVARAQHMQSSTKFRDPPDCPCQ